MTTTHPLWPLLAAAGLCLAAGCPADDPEPDPQPVDDREPVDYVDPLIGAGGEGFGIGAAFPGATTPFGLVRLGPDTAMETGAMGVFHCAGYYYEDYLIEGFSHVHLHGTGVTDYGNVMFMPTLGMDASKTDEEGYLQGFSHDAETVEAGYYAVTLDDTGIVVELTATTHAGMQRYTYPASSDAVVIVDLAHTLGEGVVDAAEVRLDPDNGEITGWMHNVGELSTRLGGVDIYFVTQVDRAPTGYGTFDGTELDEGNAVAEGADVGAYLRFSTGEGEQVLLRTGVSFIDLDHARANLEAEMDTWDFDAVRNGARTQWNDELSVIEVTGGTEDERVVFYTALYHAMLMPTTFTEVGGDYLGFDLQVHYADGFTYYTDFSMWDTFRTLHPLLALIAPDRQRDMVLSLQRMLEQGGGIPRWALATGDTGSMIGTPADQVIADSYLKGITDFDAEAMLDEMIRHADGTAEHGGRSCIEDYLTYGYVPSDDCGDATSRTLEFAYNDFAVAQLAAALGRDDDAERLYEQSRSYVNQWNPDTMFFQERFADGTWLEDFEPTAFSDDLTEATAWQYRWHVQHDADGLIELFGGAESFASELERMFELTEANPSDPLPNVYYWHGNEPVLHAVYMGAQAGRPDITQRWVRWIMATEYDTTPGGIAGNDDCGTLSAWYVFSALGFYPVVATERYIVGSPVFDEAVLHLAGGDLTIAAEGAGPDAVFVHDVALNGSTLAEPWFVHSDIVHGGRLDLVMGSEPGTWGM